MRFHWAHAARQLLYRALTSRPCSRSGISGWRDRRLYPLGGGRAAGRSVMASRAAPTVSYRHGSSKRPLATSAGGSALTILCAPPRARGGAERRAEPGTSFGPLRRSISFSQQHWHAAFNARLAVSRARGGAERRRFLFWEFGWRPRAREGIRPALWTWWRFWQWLSLALYVKAMRTPWVLKSLADDTAFVGLGFNIDPVAERGRHVVEQFSFVAVLRDPRLYTQLHQSGRNGSIFSKLIRRRAYSTANW
jgi:hypothetical protein